MVGKTVERRPTRPWTATLAWSICVLAVAGAVVFVVLEVTRGSSSVGEQLLSSGQQAFGAIAFAVVGALIVSRGRGNTIGWLFLLAAVSYMLSGVGAALSDTYEVASGAWRAGVFLNAWSWAPGFFVVGTLVLLLFPDGHLPSPRYRWVAWLAGGSIALSVVGGVLSKTAGSTPGYVSPLPTIPDAGTAISFIAGGLGVLVAAVASVISLVGRYRRSTGVERDQLRWFVYAGIATIVLTPTRVVGVHQPILLVIGLLSTLILPVAVGTAILKHRLYDIDVVISKTVVFGALAAFITLVYVGIVVGVGALLGERGHANVGLSIVATGVVAVAFQPVRERVTRVANHLVYGKRATPYEVLSEFAGRVGTTYATEDVLPRTARVIAEGTGALRADVWLRVGDHLRLSASWPPEEDGAEVVVPLPPGGTTLPPFNDAARAVPVLLQGVLLGAVTVTKAPGDPLRHTEEALLDDLAGQAGLVLANARLTAELQAHLDELTARSAELQISRQRIVIAQDEERRRLERNIHDGAQQHLVALAVKLRLARSLVSRDPAKASQMLTELRGEVDDALDTMSNLALGIYPPLLEEQGIAAALAAQYQRTDLPVRLNTDGTGRYPIDLEAAVYFCTLEALQNIAKYADAHVVDVTIGEQNGSLTFQVTDDGMGFDPSSTPRGSGLNNMLDRLSALGGDVTVESAPGRGTTIRGRVPLAGAPAPTEVVR